ncbi:MAG: hypothetical protein IKJ89_01500, partial [Kiritimatiellae bacterium]|nr:hypothetical protein [Kiritimatiellia bacterium]
MCTVSPTRTTPTRDAEAEVPTTMTSPFRCSWLHISAYGDGVPDIWESRIGTNSSSATDSLPCADTDGDGFLDAYEFLIGSDPEDFSDPTLICSSHLLGSCSSKTRNERT